MKQLFSIMLVAFFATQADAQVKIGGTPTVAHASSILELDGGNNRGLLLPRMRKQDMLAIPTPAEGLVVYTTDEQAIYIRRTGDWVKVNGDQDAFSLPYSASVNFNGPLLNLVNTNATGIAIQGQNLLGNGYGVRGFSYTGIGVNGVAQDVTGTAGYFVNNFGGIGLISIGKTGLGTSLPNALLHLDGASIPGTTVIIDDDTDPLIQLQKAGVSKGFIQTVNDDMKIGTNASNNTGSFIIRNNGSDRLFVDASGQTGIGSASTGARLYVDATNTSATAMVMNDQNPTMQLQSSGVDKGFVQLNGDDIRLGTNTNNLDGNVVLRTRGIDRVKVDTAGLVHVGASFSQPYYGQMSITTPSTNGFPYYSLELIEDRFSQQGPSVGFRERTSGHSSGYIRSEFGEMQFQSGYLGAEDFNFVCGINTALRIEGDNLNVNVRERLTIGGGSSNQTIGSMLYMSDFTKTGEVVHIEAQEPIMQFENIDFNENPSHFNVGFLQAVGHDFKIGTNAGNSGNLVIRTNGGDRAFMTSAGNMYFGGSGAGPAGGYKVAVRGKIAATDFDVVATGSWPDYVFAKEYKLKPLEEVEAFIKANNHLPNIPEAALIEKNGYGLGDMQKRTMEKVEELTLYLIEANKQIKTLTDKINKLEQKK